MSNNTSPPNDLPALPPGSSIYPGVRDSLGKKTVLVSPTAYGYSKYTCAAVDQEVGRDQLRSDLGLIWSDDTLSGENNFSKGGYELFKGDKAFNHSLDVGALGYILAQTPRGFQSTEGESPHYGIMHFSSDDPRIHLPGSALGNDLSTAYWLPSDQNEEILQAAHMQLLEPVLYKLMFQDEDVNNSTPRGYETFRIRSRASNYTWEEWMSHFIYLLQIGTADSISQAQSFFRTEIKNYRHAHYIFYGDHAPHAPTAPSNANKFWDQGLGPQTGKVLDVEDPNFGYLEEAIALYEGKFGAIKPVFDTKNVFEDYYTEFLTPFHVKELENLNHTDSVYHVDVSP